MEFGKGYWKTFKEGIEREWVVTNGIGGYCGSSIINANTRKHHGLLIASLYPPVQRTLILSKINEKIKLASHSYDFTTAQRPGCLEEGQKHLQRFIYKDYPVFRYQVEDFFMDKTIVMEPGKNTVVIQYNLINGQSEAELVFTPLFNFRDHNKCISTGQLNFKTAFDNQILKLVPKTNSNIKIQFYSEAGKFQPKTKIFDEDMTYQTEIAIGMSAIDNHYTPYDVEITLKPFEKVTFSMICSIEKDIPLNGTAIINQFSNRIQDLIKQSGQKDSFAQQLVKAADQFIVYRKSTGLKTILAGLPWFADWGRDTMIALQGLTLVTKRFEDAREILTTFAQYVQNGLVPNMFPGDGSAPIYNTADASLWYFHSVDQYLKYCPEPESYDFIKKVIFKKLKDIILAYEQGTLFSIGMDKDGLIKAGSDLDQVTWMDVRIGKFVVTPRHGKPVEINALWYNALKVMENLSGTYNEDPTHYRLLSEKVKKSFNNKFWNESANCLYDVVDKNDPKIRPNQIWAVSLPYTMLNENRSKKVVQTVLAHLYASYGLRSLSFMDPEYKGIYKGKLISRDKTYHQGTAWAFPLGGLITAYCKVHHYSDESTAFAKRLVEPLEDHLQDGCIGSIAEIFDGNEPIIPRGCFAQAWSVGEILRAYSEDILGNRPR